MLLLVRPRCTRHKWRVICRVSNKRENSCTFPIPSVMIAKAVLPFVAPGSETLIKIAEKALDASMKISDKIGESQWRDELRGRLGVQDVELQRLGEMFELLLGPLAMLCDQVRQVSDRVEEIPQVLAKALAADPSLSKALHDIEAVKIQTAAFQADLCHKWAENQAEAIPLYRRANRFYDFFDELQSAGVTAGTLANMILSWQEVADKIRRGATDGLDGAIYEMRRVVPNSACVPLLEAASLVREFDYAAAQHPLKAALRLKPGDAELLEITRGVTKLGDDTKPGGKSAPRLQPGDLLDGWRLESRLGAGGWGLVFKATRGPHTRAIKVMHRDLAEDAAFVTRFNKEITNLIKLPRHPNLVSIGADRDLVSFGFCKTHQTWYLVMEHIDGPTLEAYLAAKGPLTEGQVRTLFVDAVAGLAEAHKAGIVHRDIKPSNYVIRKSDKKLVLVDFGLAFGVEDAGKTGTSGLSVNFAAPEQHYGKSATQRSDVYSLCAVMHYALNYDKPERRTPDEFHPDEAPAAFRSLLERGLKSNPRERFVDAGELLAAITLLGTAPTHTAGGSETRLPKPTAMTAQPKPETQAERVRRIKAAAVQLHEEVKAHLELDEIEEAASLLERYPPDLISLRDSALFAETTSRRDRLRQLRNDIQARLDTGNLKDPRLPSLIAAFTRIKPNDPEMLELAREFPAPKIGQILTDGMGIKFAWVSLGQSWLGGGDGKPGDKPFMLENGLWCGIYPVTQADWEKVTGSAPKCHFKGNPRFPIESVSWTEAQAFIETLNRKTAGGGYSYRLPTEEEWEYICRGGPISQEHSKFSFYFAKSRTDLTPNPTNELNGKLANFGNTGKPSDVGTYLPNPLGIYDMHGNVWEWTSSPEASYRVFRGGCWRYQAEVCTAAYRNWCEPGNSSSSLGFRLLAVPSS